MPALQIITDRADPAVQRIVDVARPSQGAKRTVLIEDIEPLLQAISAGLEFVEVYLLEGAEHPDALLNACDSTGIPVRILGATLAGTVFKGEKRPKLFGIAKAPRPARLGALTELRGDVVVLDGVRIVGNIGAIVRTAYALGAAGVILIDSELQSVTDRRVVRASRGYVFSLPVVLASRDQVLGWLHEAGLRVFSLDIEGSGDVSKLADVSERIAVVFGSEKRGASTEFERDVESVVIPMRGTAESLNVSVAAGIALAARTSHNLR